MPDAHKNFSYSTVATAPSPPTTGTSLVVIAGDGAKFPTVPFNATVWPAGAQPTIGNAEIVRVTAVVTDTFTITRIQEGTAARSVGVGDQIASTITAKTLTDIEAAVATVAVKKGSQTGTDYTTTSIVFVDVDAANLSYTATIPTGQKLTVLAAVPIYTIAARAFARLVDGATTLHEATIDNTVGTPQPGNILNAVVIGDGASHIVKLQFAVLAGGTATINNRVASTTTTPVSPAGWAQMIFRLEAAN
jgi:hypothetical protein